MKQITRRELIRRLRLFGFQGSFSGTRHQFLKKGQLKLRIPNPHGSDIGVQLLKLILKQADISDTQWEEME